MHIIAYYNHLLQIKTIYCSGIYYGSSKVVFFFLLKEMKKAWKTCSNEGEEMGQSIWALFPFFNILLKTNLKILFVGLGPIFVIFFF